MGLVTLGNEINSKENSMQNVSLKNVGRQTGAGVE